MTSRVQVLLPLYAQDRFSVLPWAQVRVYEADGVTPFAGLIYRGISGATTYPNPFVVSPAVVKFYLPSPTRIVLGYQIDRSATELLTGIIDPWVDADEVITTAGPLWVSGTLVANGLLRASSAIEATWFQPGLAPHPHSGYAPGTTRVGPDDAISARIASYPNTTSLSASSPQIFADPQYFFTWGQLLRRARFYGDLAFRQWSYWSGSIVLAASTDLTGSTMLGYAAFGIGGYVTAIGVQAYGADGTPTPYVQGSVVLGYRGRAFSGSIALGREARSSREADFIAAGEQGLISLGRGAGGAGERAISLGANSQASRDGLAIGSFTGQALDADSSVALGSGAKVSSGLGSQVAFGATTSLSANSVRLPEKASVTVPGDLLVAGNVSVDAPGGLLGFFGSTGVSQPVVGQGETGSGIPALDSLVRALRTLGLLRVRTDAVLRYDAGDIEGTLREGVPVTSWKGDTGTLVPDAGAPFLSPGPLINGRATVALSASTRLSELIASTSVSTYLVVASHLPGDGATGESLLTLPVDDLHSRVLVMASRGVEVTRNTWEPTMSTYDLDGLDQSANRRAAIDATPHVYRATLRAGSPAAPLVVGKPANTVDPGWQGSVAEIIGLDGTWTPSEVNSLETGLMFKYGIGQSPTALRTPAMAKIIRGQEDPTKSYVDFDHRFALNRPYPVSGTVRTPSPLPTKIVNGETVPDASVRVYSTTGGVRTLEATVALRSDYSFFAVVVGVGYVTADLINSVNQRIDFDRATPPTQDGQPVATVQGLALTALAVLRMPAIHHLRAELILRVLAGVQAVNGGITTGITLGTGLPAGTVLSGALALVGMAALRYGEVTGDPQFTPMAVGAGTFLRSRVNGAGLVSSGDTGISYTSDAVLTYLLWRGLGWVSGGTQGAVLRDLLGSLYWLEAEGRAAYSLTWSPGSIIVDSTHTLWTDLWTGLYYDAIGDADRARRIRSALTSFRIRNGDQLAPR